MKRAFVLSVCCLMAMTICIVGCIEKIEPDQKPADNENKNEIEQRDLLGTWLSPPQDGKWRESEWGPAKIQMTFHADGTFDSVLTIDPLSPPGGGSVRSSGKYRLKGALLICDNFERDKPATVAIKQGRLQMRFADGEQYEFVMHP